MSHDSAQVLGYFPERLAVAGGLFHGAPNNVTKV